MIEVRVSGTWGRCVSSSSELELLMGSRMKWRSPMMILILDLVLFPGCKYLELLLKDDMDGGLVIGNIQYIESSRDSPSGGFALCKLTEQTNFRTRSKGSSVILANHCF